MLTPLPRSVRVYVATEPVRLNRSFDGLSAEVRSVLGRDPLSGHVFVFLNRRRTMVKLLVYTRGGYTIVHKRLEKGCFAFTAEVHVNTTSVEIDVHELSMLLEGVHLADVRKTRASRRWDPPRHARVA